MLQSDTYGLLLPFPHSGLRALRPKTVQTPAVSAADFWREIPFTPTNAESLQVEEIRADRFCVNPVGSRARSPLRGSLFWHSTHLGLLASNAVVTINKLGGS